jgi:hypothetical protein
VTARAASAEAGAESDEQTRRGHDTERTHASKKCGALPQRKTQRRAANQAQEKHCSPCLVGRRRDEKATEHTGNTWNLSAQHGREQASETDQDSSDQGVPECVMVHRQEAKEVRHGESVRWRIRVQSSASRLTVRSNVRHVFSRRAILYLKIRSQALHWIAGAACAITNSIVRRLTLTAFLLTALFASVARLPANTCPVASPPIGKVCRQGSCPNKACCAESQKNKSLPSTPAVKDSGASQQLVAIPTTNSPASFAYIPVVERGAAIAKAIVCAPPRLALLCTFLI